VIDSPKYENHGALKTAAKLGLMSNDIINLSSQLSPANNNYNEKSMFTNNP